jgi:hypothetical protein
MDIKASAREAHELYKTIVQLATQVEALVISAEQHLSKAEQSYSHEYLPPDLGYDISGSFKAQKEARRLCKEAADIVDTIDFRVRFDPERFEQHPNYLPSRLSFLDTKKNRMIELRDEAVDVLSQFGCGRTTRCL